MIPAEMIDINRKFIMDMDYIKTDIITKQFDIDKYAEKDEQEKYIKFSKPLNAVAIFDMTKKQYRKYWSNQYYFYPEKKEEILRLIEEKFEFGLTPLEDMLKLIHESKDLESEKNKAIKLLTKPRDRKYVQFKKGEI